MDDNDFTCTYRHNDDHLTRRDDSISTSHGSIMQNGRMTYHNA